MKLEYDKKYNNILKDQWKDHKKKLDGEYEEDRLKLVEDFKQWKVQNDIVKRKEFDKELDAMIDQVNKNASKKSKRGKLNWMRRQIRSMIFMMKIEKLKSKNRKL